MRSRNVKFHACGGTLEKGRGTEERTERKRMRQMRLNGTHFWFYQNSDRSIINIIHRLTEHRRIFNRAGDLDSATVSAARTHKFQLSMALSKNHHRARKREKAKRRHRRRCRRRCRSLADCGCFLHGPRCNFLNDCVIKTLISCA